MKIEGVKEVKIDQAYADNIKEDIELMVNAVNGAYGMVTFLRITESANVLCDALERQIPKELDMFHCKCGMIIDDDWKHCPKCGQAVKR